MTKKARKLTARAPSIISRAPSALDHIDGAAAQRGLRVLLVHVAPGILQRLDAGIERDDVRAIPPKRERGRRDRLDRPKSVPLDTGNLDETPDRIAGHAEMVLERNFGGILDLLRRAAKRLAKCAGRHCRSRSDLCLTTGLGA